MRPHIATTMHLQYHALLCVYDTRTHIPYMHDASLYTRTRIPYTCCASTVHPHPHTVHVLCIYGTPTPTYRTRTHAGNRLGLCFYSWKSVAQQRGDIRLQLQHAVLHWVGSVLGRAFIRW